MYLPRHSKRVTSSAFFAVYKGTMRFRFDYDETVLILLNSLVFITLAFVKGFGCPLLF